MSESDDVDASNQMNTIVQLQLPPNLLIYEHSMQDGTVVLIDGMHVVQHLHATTTHYEYYTTLEMNRNALSSDASVRALIVFSNESAHGGVVRIVVR